jgi:membrane fusion protein (multidrug efflux system)
LFSRPFETTDDSYAVGNQIRITARTSGRVAEIFVDNTDTVLAGQLLVSLDPTDAILALDKAKSELAAAVREVHSLQAQHQKLAAIIEARTRELALIEAEYRRRQNLKAGTSVTAEELERYRNQTLVAEANLRAAQYDLEINQRVLGAGAPATHPQVLLAASNLRQAWLNLRRCEIRSPASGRIARRAVQVGTHVDHSVALMAVVPQTEIWVEANFKESQVGRIKPGQPVTVRADMYGREAQYHGVVVGLSAGTGSVFSLLPPENATGNWIKVVQRIPVKIVLNQTDLEKAPLLLGLSLRTKIQVLEAELQATPPAQEGPTYSAWLEDTRENELNTLIENLIAENLSTIPAADEAAASDAASQTGRPNQAGQP